MEKHIIKKILRESIFTKLKEIKDSKKGDSEKETPNKEDSKSKDVKKKVETLTKKIRNATQGKGKLLKLSQVMDVAGIGDADDATDRSAIGKAVSGKPDADGNIRHLTIKQANAMNKVVDNPTAFKKG